MLKNTLYYAAKPFLPWQLRIAVRRSLARRTRVRYSSTWPIDPAAGEVPAGWSGWPNSAQFAFAISHDVEGPRGLAKCRALAEIEMQLGFRSCFNFVPEGSYKVPLSIIRWLNERRFEVGLHDLHHDGKLYTSERVFRRKAARINGHLHAWGAEGFRSAFMLRNLDWLHQLSITYDSSTFDTDPFEIQSEGVRTVFPFWVPGSPIHNSDGLRFEASPSGDSEEPGYVELPYTLPQDSTLFFVLGESSPQIWLQKLAWIAKRGGMAFVNVHPDYLRFEDEPASPTTYPIEMYLELLRHIRRCYEDDVFYSRPDEIAKWFKSTQRHAAATRPVVGGAASSYDHLRGRRAAVLLYSNYPEDPRPRRAAEAMVAAGMSVDVLCLGESAGQEREEIVNGVEVTRVRMRRRRDHKLSYILQYSIFILRAFWFLCHRGLTRRYDLVHVHNMPDILVLGAIPAKLRGAKIVLDLHDPMPELMMTIFGRKSTSFGITLLKILERWSIALADSVLTVNEACRKIFSSRSCSPEKIRIVMNSPDETVFPLQPTSGVAAVRRTDRFVFMYHGSLVERHGVDLAIAALQHVRSRYPSVELRIYGRDTPFLGRVLDSIRDSEHRDAIRYYGEKNLEEIAAAIRECDAGIIPNRKSVFTEINTPTRIFEYLSQGKPVIAPRAQGIQDYFGPDDLLFFTLGDADDLARQMERAVSDRDATAQMVDRGQKVYLQHAWAAEKNRLQQALVDVLSPSSPGQASVLDREIDELPVSQ